MLSKRESKGKKKRMKKLDCREEKWKNGEHLLFFIQKDRYGNTLHCIV